MRSIALTAILFAIGVQLAWAAPDPWAAMAQRDLQSIHDTLAANHPGAVDRENTTFARWLEDGLRLSRREARQAHTFADYRRALRRYVNGFRDSHTVVDFTAVPSGAVWPGFIIVADDSGVPRVRYSTDQNSLPLEAQLIGCDGLDFDTLLRTRVDPYFWNADVPHERAYWYNRIFYFTAADTQRLHECTFDTQSGRVTRTLNWSQVADDQYNAASAQAFGGVDPPPQFGFSEIEGVWRIRIGSFGGYGGPGAVVDAINDLERSIRENAAALHAAPKVVIDLRYNDGGNSDFGVQLANALWGETAVAAVRARIEAGQTVDWRASPANRDILARRLADPALSNAAAEYYRAAVAAIDDAMRGRAPLAIGEADATPDLPSLPTATPFRGRVYLLTNACGSSCLDFMDIALRMPGVTQVGLPTGADAAYIEASGFSPLPSGLAEMSYSMKVYRGRPRGHNQWYEPAIHWTGGPMTEGAVNAFVASLP